MKNNWGVKITEKTLVVRIGRRKILNFEGEKVRGSGFAFSHAFLRR